MFPHYASPNSVVGSIPLQQEEKMKVLSPEQKVWLEGIRAFQQGAPRSSNPYVASERFNTNNSVSWFNGWDDAQIIMSTNDGYEPVEIPTT
jgi:hypothetical protein